MQKPQTGLTSPTCRTPPGQKSGHPPDSSRADLPHPGFDATLLSNDTSTAIPENEDCAPSSRSPPDTSRAPFPHRSPRRSSTNAACGGLQPPSARAAAKGQTFISCTAPCQEALPTNRTPFHVRGTRSFSNPESRRDLLTWDDGSCLMRCHRALVSNSCHFFRTPLSLPWRHIQSLRDADQPVQKVPSRDGYPRRSARIVQRSVGDERPSSTAHLASPSMDSLYYPSLSFALSTRVAQRASPRVRLMGSASLHRP
jgi:hypothetical protein